MAALGLVANIVSVISAAQSASTALESVLKFRNVPDQILQLMNEVSDFRVILEGMQRICEVSSTAGPNPDFLSHLNQSLQEAGVVLENLNNLVKRLIGNEYDLASGISVRPKVSWKDWQKHKSTVQHLSSSLREIRREMTMKMNLLTASELPRLRVHLQEIVEATEESRESLQDRHLKTQDSIKGLERKIHTLASRATELHGLSNSISQTMNHRGQSLPGTASIRPPVISSNIRISTSFDDPRGCGKFCPCRCHKISKLKSPEILEQLVGALFIGYSGTPTFLSRRTCNEKSCKKDEGWLITVSYYFPTWFISRLITFRNHYTPTQGQTISIKTPRLVSKDSAVFNYIAFGNLTGIQELFAQGLASPFDVSEVGHSALTAAILSREHDICDFLLASGADPEHINKTSSSCIDLVWTILLETQDVQVSLSMERTFAPWLDRDEALENKNYSIIHCIVLGFSSIDLESQLRLSTSEIDARDSRGRTPLTWAVCRSDLACIRTLLKYGADPFVYGNTGLNVIHQAANRGNAKALEAILDAVSSKSIGYANCVATRSWSKTTPLMSVFLCLPYDPFEAVSKVRLLISHGADINLPSVGTGACPLSQAIFRNHHAVLQELLGQGANTDFKDNENGGLLHYAAAAADSEMLEILERAKISLPFIEEKEITGKTPLQFFDQERPSYVKEDIETNRRCREAFLKLLTSVRQTGDAPARMQEVESFNEVTDSVGVPDDVGITDNVETASCDRTADINGMQDDEIDDEFFEARTSFEI